MKETREMARMRQEMKQRRRRVIYNNDGNELFIAPITGADDFLSKRIVPALGTQVDSIFFCTLVTTLYQHDTDVSERGDDLADATRATDAHPVNLRDNMRKLRAAGKDCFTLVVEKCHEAGVEVFWSHRINDIHDTFASWLLSQWKRQHPECLMGSSANKEKYPSTDPRYWWSFLDFGVPAVREYLTRINAEVCRSYDMDGIEIDYLRHPLFFRSNLECKPASAEELDTLTAFQRGVREAALREGARRGRPILVAARVPMDVGTCRHIGIDVERWLREDLLDLLVIGGGYTPFTMPMRELVELGHAHGLPVYPVISASGMRGTYGAIAAWCGAAANVWQAGGDGVYLFNTFPSTPNHPHFTMLGDPVALAGYDKIFAIDSGGFDDGWLKQAVVQSQTLPVELDSGGQPREVVLPVGDDIAAAARDGRLGSAVVHVAFDSFAPGDAVAVTLNGSPIEPDDASVARKTFRPAPTQSRHGDNTLELRVTARAAASAAPLVVKSVELHVDYK